MCLVQLNECGCIHGTYGHVTSSWLGFRMVMAVTANIILPTEDQSKEKGVSQKIYWQNAKYEL